MSTHTEGRVPVSYKWLAHCLLYPHVWITGCFSLHTSSLCVDVIVPLSLCLCKWKCGASAASEHTVTKHQTWRLHEVLESVCSYLRHFHCPHSVCVCVFCVISVRRGDVLAAWSGIRPLVTDPNSKDTQSICRNHIVNISESGLVTIAGQFSRTQSCLCFAAWGNKSCYVFQSASGVGCAVCLCQRRLPFIPIVRSDARVSFTSIWITSVLIHLRKNGSLRVL